MHKKIQKERYLKPVDDGLLIPSTGRWTATKLDYLRRYLERFIVSMREKKWRAIHYIDLFSGTGKYQLRGTDRVVLGSPLIALTQKRPFDRYFFSDINPENIDVLKQRCTPSPHFEKIRFYVGDANTQVAKVKEEIDGIDNKYLEGVWSSLNIAFLDPFGLELEWKTVETLAKSNRMDLVVYYSQMGITREAPKVIGKKPPTAIDDFFGGTEWRDIYREYQEKSEMFLHRKLLDLYKGKLKDLGYVIRDIQNEPLIRSTKRRAPLYRLLFASKHNLGNKFWNDVIKKDDSGQMTMW